MSTESRVIVPTQSFISFVTGTPQPADTVAMSGSPTYLGDAMSLAGYFLVERDERLLQYVGVIRVKDATHDGWLTFGYEGEQS